MTTRGTWPRRALDAAPWLLAISLLAHGTTVAFNVAMDMMDLMVYRDGSPRLAEGDLYQWRLMTDAARDFPLPFAYPPFAALVFTPLSWLPWAVVRWLWQLISLGCLWYVVRCSLRLAGCRSVRRAMLWTSLLIWIEPVRATLTLGQVNLVLAALVFAALVSVRSWCAGAGVGIAAGIKLVPAVSVLYLLAARRPAAAVWSLAAFAVAAGLGVLASAAQSGWFWLSLLDGSIQDLPIGSAINQSLRGALSRTVGHDVGFGPLYLLAATGAAILTAWALRSALRAGDVLGTIVSVQLFGLLVSPISWSHHWVWVIPALVWLTQRRDHRLCLFTASGWLLVAGGYLVTILLGLQHSMWVVGRPWYEATLGWAYPAAAVLTLLTVALARRAVVIPRSSAGLRGSVS
jgi:alpha-1,2-mannosyltransferase